MELIHTLPKKDLKNRPKQRYEFYLAEEILKDPYYYRDNVFSSSSYKILDNSFNELGYSVNIEDLAKAAEYILPDEIVYPDDIDPDRSEYMLHESEAMLVNFPQLYSVKKMAVLHANSWDDVYRGLDSLCNDENVDVIGLTKVMARKFGTTTYPSSGRMRIVESILNRTSAKKIHLLGFAGFEEFEHFEYLTSYIRSMDSRLMLYSNNLWSRDYILSNVALDGPSFSESTGEDLEQRILQVRKEYESYGLC